jgi:hypothetical protein
VEFPYDWRCGGVSRALGDRDCFGCLDHAARLTRETKILTVAAAVSAAKLPGLAGDTPATTEAESPLLASQTSHILFRTEDVDENNQRYQLR